MTDQPITQMIYAWQGAADVSLVAASSRPAVPEGDIRRRVRMQDTARLRRPSNSMCYVRYPDAAFVLRRANGGGDDRTDVCHVLVGSRELTPSLALATQDWRGWIDSMAGFGRGPLLDLSSAMLERHQTVTQSLSPDHLNPDDRLLVVRMVAQVLRDLTSRPQSRTVVFDPKAADRASRVLSAVVDQLTAFYAGLPDEQQRYGFSTWETAYVGKSALAGGQIVFAPEIHQDDRYASNWSTVMAASIPSGPDVWDHVAAEWMALWTVERSNVTTWLTRHGVLNQPSLAERLDVIVRARMQGRGAATGVPRDGREDVIEKLHGTARCPICLDVFPWTEADAYLKRDADYVKSDITIFQDENRRTNARRQAHLKCPNRGNLFQTAMEDHFLPMDLVRHKLIVLGFVGGSKTGKSHLLASMVDAIDGSGLANYGIRATPVDSRAHADFMKKAVEPLREGRKVPPTAEGIATFVDAFLIEMPGRNTEPHAVAFFDVAGGDLQAQGAAGEFVIGTQGLFYVVDPGAALKFHGLSGPSDVVVKSDPAIRAVLSRMRPTGAQYSKVPAATVLVKADRYRFMAPVDTWLHQPKSANVDVARILAESRDACGLLHKSGAMAWVEPLDTHEQCTFHFASATGSDIELGPDGEDGDRFLRELRPMRVLEPLIAMLIMTGAIPADTNPIRPA